MMKVTLRLFQLIWNDRYDTSVFLKVNKENESKIFIWSHQRNNSPPLIV